MRKFKCTICGYTFDESKGLPEKGVAAGTQWEDIPKDFICPLCGAPKNSFEELKEAPSVIPNQKSAENEGYRNLYDLSAGELSAVCSNLAKGCEKQHLSEEMNLFYQLAEYFKSKATAQTDNTFKDISELLKADLSEGYAEANSAAIKKSDRGALRALTWSEKVSRMINSLIDRYAKEGEKMLENTKIHVCDICGFIYVGDNLPEVCPVCKVPNFKISQIERR